MANTIQITIQIDKKGKGVSGATKELGLLSSAAKGASGILGGFGRALGGVATVAGGIVAANIFGKIVSGMAAFVTTGIDAVGSSQQLEISLKALLSQNNMYEQSVQTVTQAITEQILTQDEYQIKLSELEVKLKIQQATFQENQQRLIQLTA